MQGALPIETREEIWKPIPGYNGWYDASNKGRIRSWKKAHGKMQGIPMLLKPQKHHQGYLRIYLQLDGRTVRERIHCLVATTFIGLRPEKYDVNHINGQKDDNRLENLEYMTRSENLCHARDILGNLNNQKLKRQQAEEIIILLTNGQLSYTEIADLYSVQRDTVRQIWNRRRWKELSRNYPSGTHYDEWRKTKLSLHHQMSYSSGT
jgi:hypothetical protein